MKTKTYTNATAMLLFSLSTDWDGKDIVAYLTAQQKTLHGEQAKLVSSFVDGFSSAPTPYPSPGWPRDVLKAVAHDLETGSSIQEEIDLNEVVAQAFANTSAVDTGAGDNDTGDQPGAEFDRVQRPTEEDVDPDTNDNEEETEEEAEEAYIATILGYESDDEDDN